MTIDTDQVVRSGSISRPQAEAMGGLLDLGTLPPGGLPELWHWTQLLEAPPQASLGSEGHPSRGIPAPPAPDHKRMFAGGRVRTHRLLKYDQAAERLTEPVDSVTKQGRSGPLTLVTVRHTWTQDGQPCVVEENDIVYREAGSILEAVPGRLDLPGPDVGEGPAVRVVADETFLFRFSALTYNAHRIHYDAGWAEHEGYPGLVVHGPLQALLMGELFRRSGGGLVGHEFSFRLRAPMVGTQVVTAVPAGDGLARGARVLDVHGNVTATSTRAPLGKGGRTAAWVA